MYVQSPKTSWATVFPAPSCDPRECQHVSLHCDIYMWSVLLALWCALCLTSRGSVVTQECVEKLIKKDMIDPVAGDKLSDKDIIPLQRVCVYFCTKVSPNCTCTQTWTYGADSLSCVLTGWNWLLCIRSWPQCQRGSSSDASVRLHSVVTVILCMYTLRVVLGSGSHDKFIYDFLSPIFYFFLFRWTFYKWIMSWLIWCVLDFFYFFIFTVMQLFMDFSSLFNLKALTAFDTIFI